MSKIKKKYVGKIGYCDNSNLKRNLWLTND